MRYMTAITFVLWACALLAGEPAPVSHAPPASARFEAAYALLSDAEAARDREAFSKAADLFKQAHTAYEKFMADYPYWQPGVTRLRADYCARQQVHTQNAAQRAPA